MYRARGTEEAALVTVTRSYVRNGMHRGMDGDGRGWLLQSLQRVFLRAALVTHVPRVSATLHGDGGSNEKHPFRVRLCEYSPHSPKYLASTVLYEGTLSCLVIYTRHATGKLSLEMIPVLP